MDERRSPANGTISSVAFDESALAPLCDLVRQHLPSPVGPDEARAAHLRFLGARKGTGAATTTRTSRRRLWVAVAAGAAVAVVVVVRLAMPGPLRVTVAGGAVEDGGYVRVPADGESTLRFSDGTSVELAPSSRMRIAATGNNGARLLLEEGRARASVVPKPGARWLFDAGPCRVHVTGTRFDMRWSPRDQVLEVWLASGSVVVQGPPAREGVAMQAGQHLAMDVRRGTVRLGNDDSAGAAKGTPEEASLGVGDTVQPQINPPLPVSRGPGTKRGADWSARVAGGEFGGVIAEAERRGISEVLNHDGVANVMALADAARYAGRLNLARRSLVDLRARFPASLSAHRAAFLLGRISEDSDHDVRNALVWYSAYLADASDDVYRAEALGRQMTATLRVSGVTRAGPLATSYLQHYPRGAYADAARAILRP
jgi:FecR protein